jgi:hypothetical protein
MLIQHTLSAFAALAMLIRAAPATAATVTDSPNATLKGQSGLRILTPGPRRWSRGDAWVKQKRRLHAPHSHGRTQPATC